MIQLARAMRKNRDIIKEEIRAEKSTGVYAFPPKVPICLATDGAWNYKARLQSHRGVVFIMARVGIWGEWRLVATLFMRMLNTAAATRDVRA